MCRKKEALFDWLSHQLLLQILILLHQTVCLLLGQI